MLVRDLSGELNSNRKVHHSFQDSCLPKSSLHPLKLSLILLIPLEEDWWWRAVRLWLISNTRVLLIALPKFSAKRESPDFSRVTWATSGEVLEVHWCWFFMMNSKKCLLIMLIDTIHKRFNVVQLKGILDFYLTFVLYSILLYVFIFNLIKFVDFSTSEFKSNLKSISYCYKNGKA